ncbi:Transposase DDE domain group 1 [Fodinibius roseus]|uniref:Transposase DDE domain group 1 n=1 Tax=Fodinibius roseus TaxID=1194090 RepID=A0A1M5MCR5_9BACT|nr:IS1380 family transposase [Fodinibius roseus]SHG75015.1 Transposase DDE domain group 1 [Fodinibius roseus]
MNFDIELTSTPITSHAGLAFIGEQLTEAKFEHHMQTLVPGPTRSDRIPDADLAKTMVGLICCGKPYFDAVGDYAGDPYFPHVLGLSRLPSAPILRQRIEALPEEAGKAFRGFTTRLLARHPQQLTEELHGEPYCPIHIDVTPMDNSGSAKEGVSCTYKKFDGYAPIFAYIGPHGFMLDNQLRAGKTHCNGEGTLEWLKQVLKRAEAASSTRRLLVTDAGHDAADNLLLFGQTADTDFVVKRNMRRDDLAEWLKKAKRQTSDQAREHIDCGACGYYGQGELPLPGHPEQRLRVVWRAIERQASPDGQLLVEPEITIEAYWTSLDWSPQAIQRFYEKRGTSEQFHSELKTDLDLERLPSGKLQGNQHVLDLGMIAYNLLRLLGQQMLGSGLVPGRKSQSKRLRLRTVMQNLIYMAGRWISHARQWCLRIFEGHGWAQAALSLAPD